jgi:hypothetical protein
MATSLVKLHLSPEAALLLMMAIIVGGLVNIPVKRIAHERVVPVHPLAVFGLGGLWPEMRRERRETIIAVNFGGCVVPTGVALYELLQLTAHIALALWAVLVAGIVNIAVLFPRPAGAGCRHPATRPGARGGGGDPGADLCSKRGGAGRLYRGRGRSTHRPRSSSSEGDRAERGRDGQYRRSWDFRHNGGWHRQGEKNDRFEKGTHVTVGHRSPNAIFCHL